MKGKEREREGEKERKEEKKWGEGRDKERAKGGKLGRNNKVLLSCHTEGPGFDCFLLFLFPCSNGWFFVSLSISHGVLA